jgi:hypothetical protein
MRRRLARRTIDTAHRPRYETDVDAQTLAAHPAQFLPDGCNVFLRVHGSELRLAIDPVNEVWDDVSPLIDRQVAHPLGEYLKIRS